MRRQNAPCNRQWTRLSMSPPEGIQQMRTRGPMQRVSLLITLSLCLAACQSNGAGNTEPGQGDTTAAAGTAENVPEKQSFSEWLDDLRDEAMAAGVSGDTFDSAFATVRVNPEIVAKDRDQSEFTKPVWSYLDSAVSPERVANGKI